ncbi:recombinase family protein [Kocuria sp. CPCC 204721]|uniref:recombinase family protein n=1 Tax=Kocuria sp. CPCC 204721 TaxID=3073548 RepID=UPI0034D66281
MRAIGYIRVSTAGQVNDGLSLDVQRQQITAYATQHGLELEIIQDAGLSGRRRDRPGWREVIRRCEAGEADVLVVPSLSRCARSANQILELTDRLTDHGVTFVSLKESIDLSTPMGRMIRTMLAAVAELEVEQTRERTIDGKREAIRTRNTWPGGRPPTGWRCVGDGKLEPDPDQRRALEIIKHGYLVDDVSSYEIAKRLDAAGIAPHGGTTWQSSTVRRVAENPVMWSGQLVYGHPRDQTRQNRYRSTKTNRDGEPLAGEPLTLQLPSPPWTRAEFEAIGQAVRRRRDRSNQTSRTTTVHPLSGHLTMPCGRHAYGVDLSKSLKTTGARAYRCSGKRSPDPCSCSQLQAGPLEEYVFGRLLSLIWDPQAMAATVTAWFDTLRQQAEPERLRELTAQREKVTQRLDRLVEVAMDTDSATVRRKIVELEDRLDELAELIETAQTEQAEIDAQQLDWAAKLRQVGPPDENSTPRDMATLADAYQLDVQVVQSHRGFAQRVEIRGVLSPGTEPTQLVPREAAASTMTAYSAVDAPRSGSSGSTAVRGRTSAVGIDWVASSTGISVGSSNAVVQAGSVIVDMVVFLFVGCS